MTSVLPKNTNTGMNGSAAVGSGDQIGGYNFPVQICKRSMVLASSGARLFHNVMLFKDISLSWGRWASSKTQMKSSFPFAPVDDASAAAADDDVDQRKVTEGKMHIEKALGNI